MKCPNCNNEIDSEFFTCEYSCSSNEIYWCEQCGSIAVGYHGYEPDDDVWISPNG